METVVRRVKALAAVPLLALLAGAPAMPPRAQAQTEDPCGRTLATVSEGYLRLRGLKASFRHTLKARALNQEETEEGKLYLIRGGKMRWEYTDPPGKLAVADGKSSYLYLPSEGQVYVQPLGVGAEVPLPLRLLTGQVRLGDEVACEKATRKGQAVTLQLRLLKEEAEVKNLEVTVDEGRGVVTEVRYEDAIGNAVAFTLTDITFPDVLPETLFRFSPPAGAKVIRSG